MKDSIFIGDGWTGAEGGGRRPTVDSDRRGEDVGEGQRWWPGGRDGVVAGEGNGWTGAEGGGRRWTLVGEGRRWWPCGEGHGG
jgi:hypothetical protein